jgi:hypothetical protein
MAAFCVRGDRARLLQQHLRRSPPGGQFVASFHDGVCIGLADQDKGLKNLGIAIAVDCLVRIIDTQTLEQAACALGDLVQLFAPLRWGYAPSSLSIQPEPQGRGFELSFEIRDGLDRNADRSGDLLKVRVLVRSNFDSESLEPHT